MVIPIFAVRNRYLRLVLASAICLSLSLTALGQEVSERFDVKDVGIGGVFLGQPLDSQRMSAPEVDTVDSAGIRELSFGPECVRVFLSRGVVVRVDGVRLKYGEFLFAAQSGDEMGGTIEQLYSAFGKPDEIIVHSNGVEGLTYNYRSEDGVLSILLSPLGPARELRTAYFSVER